jgi:rRNA processing protein Gar1
MSTKRAYGDNVDEEDEVDDMAVAAMYAAAMPIAPAIQAIETADITTTGRDVTANIDDVDENEIDLDEMDTEETDDKVNEAASENNLQENNDADGATEAESIKDKPQAETNVMKDGEVVDTITKQELANDQSLAQNDATINDRNQPAAQELNSDENMQRTEIDDTKQDDDDSESDTSEVDLTEELARLKEWEDVADDEDDGEVSAATKPKTVHEIDPYSVSWDQLQSIFRWHQSQSNVQAGTNPLPSNGQSGDFAQNHSTPLSLQFSLPADNVKLQLAGTVQHYLADERTIVIQSQPGVLLDEGTLLVIMFHSSEGANCTVETDTSTNGNKDKQVVALGRILEVFGPVYQPMYSIRLPEMATIRQEKALKQQQPTPDRAQKDESKGEDVEAGIAEEPLDAFPNKTSDNNNDCDIKEEKVDDGMANADIACALYSSMQTDTAETTANDTTAEPTAHNTTAEPIANDSTAEPTANDSTTQRTQPQPPSSPAVVDQVIPSLQPPKVQDDPWSTNGSYTRYIRRHQQSGNKSLLSVFYFPDEAILIDPVMVARWSGKGCDASNQHDEEATNPNEMYYSDDEEERQAKKGNQRSRRQQNQDQQPQQQQRQYQHQDYRQRQHEPRQYQPQHHQQRHSMQPPLQQSGARHTGRPYHQGGQTPARGPPNHTHNHNHGYNHNHNGSFPPQYSNHGNNAPPMGFHPQSNMPQTHNMHMMQPPAPRYPQSPADSGPAYNASPYMHTQQPFSPAYPQYSHPAMPNVVPPAAVMYNSNAMANCHAQQQSQHEEDEDDTIYYD